MKKVSNQVIKEDIWHEVGAAGEPAFANSWVNYGEPFNTAAYMKDAMGFVHIKGLIKNGTIGASAFTLPAGYRPSKAYMFASVANDLDRPGRVQVDNAGGVTIVWGNNGFVSLDNLIFKAE